MRFLCFTWNDKIATWLDTDKFGIYHVIFIATTKKTIKRDTDKTL